MTEGPLGPFVFDTSAESWFGRTEDAAARRWFESYMERHLVWISAVTVLERLTGYAIAINRADPETAVRFKGYRDKYAVDQERVLPVDLATSAVAAELLALIPQPPSPPKRTHRAVESRADRLARWRFDVIIASTAIVNRMPLMHDNPEDFEVIRTKLELEPERLPGLGPLDLYRCIRLGQQRRAATS
ncbi:MAG: hypothetical protein U0Q16_06655 [Bryobacteraceae bacterium]